MDRAQFWSLIEETKSESGGDCDRQVELLQERLVRWLEEEIVAFGEILEQLLHEGYTWELWAAGYLINGGCSDDGFEYFRLWLIAQGEHIYGNAVKDPDSLAEFPGEFPESAECEELGYVWLKAFKQKMEEVLQWFPPDDALHTTEWLLQPDAAPLFSSEALSDLTHLRDALRLACSEDVPFCLLLREGSWVSGLEMDRRKGSFF